MGYDIEKEKREAIEAGRRALNSLQTAKENLNSAKNWGLVDMFGGGFFTTMLKHSKMDQAKQNMEQAKYDLRNFSRELNDVNMACDLHQYRRFSFICRLFFRWICCGLDGPGSN